RLPRRNPAAGRRLGRAPLHRHRLPRRLLLELPPVSRRLPRDGPRPGAGMTLLVLAPMAIEEAALRTDGRVLRTGMGPERARIAAARALAIDANNVAIAGLCGGVDPALRPGDVVCANELRREDGTNVAISGAEELAATARRHGLRAHVGPLVSSNRVLSPAERSSLDGALAV